MRMSIVGLAFSGKTTFFELLTKHGFTGAMSGKKGGNIGTVVGTMKLPKGVAVKSDSSVVVIGDTPLDIRCATAAGARSIAVATGLFDVQTLERKGATAVLPDLTDWKAFLAILDEF